MVDEVIDSDECLIEWSDRCNGWSDKMMEIIDGVIKRLRELSNGRNG